MLDLDRVETFIRFGPRGGPPSLGPHARTNAKRRHSASGASAEWGYFDVNSSGREERARRAGERGLGDSSHLARRHG